MVVFVVSMERGIESMNGDNERVPRDTFCILFFFKE